MVIDKEEILDWLQEVKDPEIPVLSLVDLGVITDVEISNGHVKVTMTPTFIGCPAMDYMKKDVLDTLKRHGIEGPEVEVSFEKPWNSNKITEKGRKALKEYGLAPPPKHNLIVDLEILEQVACSYLPLER
jgi:ring-1,2-phenylacetyl-CoA epoxidase subunit PaaD